MHLRDVGGGGVQRRLARQLRLDHQARAHDFARDCWRGDIRDRRDFRDRPGADEGALADMPPELALLFEHGQRLAQFPARDAEQLGELALRRQCALASDSAAPERHGAASARFGRGRRSVPAPCFRSCQQSPLRPAQNPPIRLTITRIVLINKYWLQCQQGRKTRNAHQNLQDHEGQMGGSDETNSLMLKGLAARPRRCRLDARHAAANAQERCASRSATSCRSRRWPSSSRWNAPRSAASTTS